jgi:hypothetical protein
MTVVASEPVCARDATTLPPVSRIVSVVEADDDGSCVLRLTAPADGAGSRRPAVFETTLRLPRSTPSPRRTPSTAPFAVRLEVVDGRIVNAWGFFRGTRGAERRDVTAACALRVLRAGVHGTVTCSDRPRRLPE